jgi:hypothetical protein
MPMRLKTPFFTTLILVLIAVFGFQVQDSYAAVYKTGYAKFTTYFETGSFYLPKGTFVYKDSTRSKYHPAFEPYVYYVDLYKGNKKVKRILTAKSEGKERSHSIKFKVSSSGNYKLRFTKSQKHGYSKGEVHVQKYSISN